MKCSVAIVGAGPAGIAAAATLAEHGADCVVVDQAPRPGGQIWRQGPGSAPYAGSAAWLSRFRRPSIRFLGETTLWGIDRDTRSLIGDRAGHSVSIAAENVILATGARELFLPFPGWTLPGVFGAGGAQALTKEGLHVAGRRVVVAGSGPLLLPVAALLAQHGARVTHVVEQSTLRRLGRLALGLWKHPPRLLQAARYRLGFLRAQYLTDAWVEQAVGDRRVREVRINRSGRVSDVPCDILCCSYGLVPSIELGEAAGCRTEGGAICVDAARRSSIPWLLCAGETTGVAGVDAAVLGGRIAALSALGREPQSARLAMRHQAELTLAARMNRAFALRREVLELAQPSTIVCRCEDVVLESLGGAESWRELKLRTRIGMGACQGRVCGAAIAAMYGISPDPGRFPVYPAPVGSLVGDDR